MQNTKSLADLFADILKTFPDTQSKPRVEHVPPLPPPKLPLGKLSKKKQWESLIWNIDTAEAHGPQALNGLTLALARIIQANILGGLLLDARPGRTAPDSPDTLLWDASLKIKADGSTMKDLLRPSQKNAPLPMAHTAVIPQPWERWRLSRALQNLGQDGGWGKWRQTENTYSIGWRPWPVVWISNGNHTAMASILTHGGELEVSDWLDAEELLLSVTCNGTNWLRTDDGQTIAPVESLPMAGIFEIGRRLVKTPKR